MKKQLIAFVAACLVLCMIPSVGMLFCPTTQTTENRAMAPKPALTDQDGGLNQQVFREFETYFNEHIALRNQMVYADASIQSGLFQESNVSGVICGTDGWLYYSSTLDDYLGRNAMSDRELYNLAHNFALVQEYLQQRDIDFVLTVAPNKNTLYGENMPYYNSYVVEKDRNAQRLQPLLEAQKVSYLDLFTLFRLQNEVLYLKQDSHWNQKGACLVYNAIMDYFALEHQDYSTVTPQPVETADGDLNRMLYSFYGPTETDYDYGLTPSYTYANNADSVEDGWIVTENPGGTGTLLMFRDSFADSLIPFLSNEFSTAYYSKGEPNALERYVELYGPDQVVIQKVERNIGNYLDNPPLITGPETQLPTSILISDTDSTVQVQTSMYSADYYAISGTVDKTRLQNDTQILVCVNGRVYRAYHTGENGYLLYLKKAELTEPAIVQVYTMTQDSCTQVLSQKPQLS